MDNLVYSVPTKLKKATAKPNKRRKPNNPAGATGNSPVKVVYISNPMRIKVTASEFRSLVQELTGQFSELPDPTKFSPDGVPLGPAGDPTRAVPVDDEYGSAKEEELGLGFGGGGGGASSLSSSFPLVEEDDEGLVQEVPAGSGTGPYGRPHPFGQGFNIINNDYEDDSDEVFTPQMMESLVELWPSSLLYGSL